MSTHIETHANELLKSHGLRVTAPRIAVIEVFEQRDYALSHADLEKVLSGKIDRVTVYRTLNAFEASGIVHKVLDDGGVLKYALCVEQCNSDSHVHNHVHFKCKVCETSECLVDVKIPAFSIPAGYELQESNVLMSGVCANCSQ
ncbi:MAG: transcriptional repressor [Flavobacteriales bacterium]|nr:transcriptional repressor [Flavobacteriales bacterium]